MTRKQIGLLVTAVALLGFAATTAYTERDAFRSFLGLSKGPPRRKVLSPAERAVMNKANEEKRLQREAEEREKVEREVVEQQERFAARASAFLEPTSRWKHEPDWVKRVLLDRNGRAVVWTEGEVSDSRGRDVAIETSIRELLSGKTPLLISKAKPLLIDSRDRVWFGRFQASLPATQPGAKAIDFKDQDLVVYEEGKFSAVRDIVLGKVADDPTSQAIFASAAGFEHGFEDDQGNLYFIGGLGGWFGCVDRLGTDGRWSRATAQDNFNQILSYPMFTDLGDGRVVFSVENRSQRASPHMILICDRGQWVNASLRFREGGQGYLSDVTITADGKVIFVDDDQIIMYDLDGYSPDRLEARLKALSSDLAQRDPDVQNRALEALARFPRQAVAQIRQMAEQVKVLDTRKRLESAISQIETAQQARLPLDGRFEPRGVALVGRSRAGGARFAATEVIDLATGKALGPTLLEYAPGNGWSARPLKMLASGRDAFADLLFGVGRGREDHQGRTWFADTSWLGPEGDLHAGDYPDLFDGAPVIDAEGRLYYSGSYVKDNFIYSRGRYVCFPEVSASPEQALAFRRTIPGTDEWTAATQATDQSTP